MSEANKEVVRRFTEQAWGSGDMGAADAVLAEDLIEHNPLPGQEPGREGHKQLIAAFRAASPPPPVAAYADDPGGGRSAGRRGRRRILFAGTSRRGDDGRGGHLHLYAPRPRPAAAIPPSAASGCGLPE